MIKQEIPTTIKIKDYDLWWLAGFFDAEGSIYRESSPQMNVTSSDKDVIERVAKLWGTYISIRNDPRLDKKGNNYSTTYRCQISGNTARLWGGVLKHICCARKAGKMHHWIKKETIGSIKIIRTTENLKDHWAAGLLEGDGCFLIRNRKYDRSIRVKVNMTDNDAVFRFANHFGLSKPFLRTDTVDLEGPKRIQFEANAAGIKAEKICTTILPMMGIRRSKRIRELLAHYQGVKDAKMQELEKV